MVRPATDGCSATPGVDPGLLPTCCEGGRARCVPASFVPASLQRQFGTCPGGVCVPDAIVRAGTSYAPRRCASLGGADGRCLSVCIPMVAMNRALLPRSDCAEDERCAPCINPLTMMPSGACDAVSTGCDDAGPSATDASSSDASTAGPEGGTGCPYTGPPLVDPASFPNCCGWGGAHCVPMALVPAESAAQLARCPGGYCAPDPFIAAAGRYVPPTCNSLGNAEGRCLSVCLPQVAAQMDRLPTSSCAFNQRCVPCFDPFTGMPTGACSQSCDPGPTRPPVRFADCCSRRGRCIPTAAVPAAQRDQVDMRDCMRDHLCVPNENLDPTFRGGPRCGATNLLTGQAYAGVCVSTCARLGFFGRISLTRGNCDGDHVCAPCINPLTGRPTGAPGC